MKQRFLHFLLTAVLLAGCTTRAVQTKPPLFTAAAPQTFPTAIRTMFAESPISPATPLGYPASTEAPYPAQQTQPAQATTAGTAYPAPQAMAVASPAVQGTAVPFHDCARTPGLAGCGANAVPLKARLAYIDSTPSRLVGLDLENGQGWQLPLLAGSSPLGLDWSPPGKDSQRLLLSLEDHRYQVFSAAGDALESGASQTPPAWQPDGALGKEGAVDAENGDQALLEHTPDSRWLLHIKTAQGEKNLPLNANPGDIIYRLLSWVPGGQTLLVQSYFASNQAMTQGGQLSTVDAGSGTIQTYPASMPINDNPAGYFAWDPSQPGRLALLETSETSVVAPRLILLDIQTGQPQLPLPEGLLINGLAWNPDGRLAFAVGSVAGLTTEARKAFPAPGIYLLDPQSGKTQSLTVSPSGAVDTWPQWTADGQTLVYARAIGGSDGGLLLQVRARRISDGAEWVLVEGLKVAGSVIEPNFAGRWLAFSRK